MPSPKLVPLVLSDAERASRVRLIQGRMGALGDAPRPGAPRKTTDEQVEVLVTRTLTEKGPGQDTHWSTRTMAAEAGLSPRRSGSGW